MKNHLILGNWNALCDSCGRKFKATDLKKRWDGLMVCREDWEQRHPQDLLRVQREQISVPFARPYPAEDTYLPWNYSEFPKDILPLDDLVAKIITKRFGYDPTNSGYNSYAFNTAPLNGAGIPLAYEEERVVFSETFLAALARYLTDTTSVSDSLTKTVDKVLADTISIGESVWFAEQEHSADTLALSEVKAILVTKQMTDTLSISESTTYKLNTPFALNGAALNTQTLG